MYNGIEQSYLESKTDKYIYENGYVIKYNETKNTGVTSKKMEEIKEELRTGIEDGYQFHLGMRGTKENPISFILYPENESNYYLEYKLHGAHAVKITDVTEEGIYFSTWGDKAFISFEDLQKEEFRITWSNISKKE